MTSRFRKLIKYKPRKGCYFFVLAKQKYYAVWYEVEGSSDWENDIIDYDMGFLKEKPNYLLGDFLDLDDCKTWYHELQRIAKSRGPPPLEVQDFLPQDWPQYRRYDI